MDPSDYLLSHSNKRQEDNSPDGSGASILEDSGTTRTLEQLQTFCSQKVLYWSSLLGLEGWKINVDFPENLKLEDPDKYFPINMFNVTMWSIKQATIFVGQDETWKDTDDELSKSLLHELLHVVVNEIRSDISRNPEKGHGCSCEHDHEERVVNQLTDSFWRIEAGRQDGLNTLQYYLDRGETHLHELSEAQEQIAELTQANNGHVEMTEGYLIRIQDLERKLGLVQANLSAVSQEHNLLT